MDLTHFMAFLLDVAFLPFRIPLFANSAEPVHTERQNLDLSARSLRNARYGSSLTSVLMPFPPGMIRIPPSLNSDEGRVTIFTPCALMTIPPDFER